jgi:hypothetical protein
MKSHFLSLALTAARAGLASSPAALIAIGVAAGMTSPQAHAWQNQYESIGRTVGGEVARHAAGGGVFSPAARIAGLLGETVGANLGKPFDQQSEAERKEAENIQRAKEQAQRDAAYDKERRRIDPSYDPSASYGDMVRRSSQASSGFGDVDANIRALNERSQAVIDEYKKRNAPRNR